MLVRRSLVVVIALACCLATIIGSPTSSAVEHRRAEPGPESQRAVATRADDAVHPLTIRGLPAVRTRAGVPGRTRVLVMRVYWSGQPPKFPDTSQMRGLMKDTAAWFARVSRGRHHLTSKVTPWLKVGGGTSNCGSLREPVQRAVAAARKRGIGTGGFNRFMVVSPGCGGTSYGEKPGRVTWIRAAKPDVSLLVHELGHNLGLDHANSSICSQNERRVTEGGKCFTSEYGDMWDAMGLSSRSYSVAVLRRLGWAGRVVTASASGTWTLRDAEQPGQGIQGLRVPSGKVSYWLEYRTNPNALDDSPGQQGISGEPGLQIRVDNGAKSLRVLDAAPGNPVPYLSFPDPDFVDIALPVGSSFTTRQRVRITLLAQTASSATVRIGRNKAAKAPDAPMVTEAVAQPNSGYVRLRVEPGSDNGQVILGYQLTRYPGGKTTFVADPGGSGRYDVSDSGSGAVAWTARAINQVGMSPESAKTSVHVPVPTVSIVSPAPGAVVAGPTVPVSVSVTPDPISHAAITQVVVCLESSGCETDKTAPYAVTLSGVMAGPDQISATATDVEGGQGVAKMPVTVVASPPSVHIDAPANGSPVTTGEDFAVTVTATANASTGSPVVEVGFTVYDATGGFVTSDYASAATISSLVSVFQPGSYRIEATATDANGYSSPPSVVQVTASDPPP
jgi:hypothetical protein